MRILWLSVLLVGLCLAREEESPNDLQHVEGRRLQRTSFGSTSSSSSSSSPCHGCNPGVDKTTSSVVVPNLLGNKNDLLSQALGSGHDFVGNIQNPADDLLLKIGDIISFLNPGGSGTTDHNSYKPTLDLNKLNDLNGNDDLAAILGTMGGLAGGVGALEKLGSIFTVLNMFKAKSLQVLSAGLQIANFILAVIGLAMIIGYVAENDGNLGVLGFGLTGTDESGTGYGSGSGSGSSGYARSYSETPVMQGLTNLVYDAIGKYD